MPASLTADGLQTLTLAEQIAEFNTALQDPSTGFGPDFDVSDHELVPRLMHIVAEASVRNQSLIRSAIAALTAGAARGVFADNLAALTGITRRGDTYSSVEVELVGTASATIPASRVARHNPTNTLWTVTDAVVLDGSGIGTATAVANEPGPISIVASADWTIVLGDANLTSVESTEASEPGALAETDEQLEARRQTEAARVGSSTARGIRQGVLDVLEEEGYEDVVDSVTVFVNFSAVTDAFGRPPKSVEVLVDDNNLIPDAIIAQAVWRSIAAGIEPWGLITETIVDEAGDDQEVGFSRSTGVSIYVEVTVDSTGAEVALGDETALETAIEDAVEAYGNANHPAGRNVIPVAFVPSILAELVPGSYSAVTVRVGDDGIAWQSTPYSVEGREEARFAAARVTVIFTP